MRNLVFAIIFLILGLGFVAACFYFALLPTSDYSRIQGEFYINQNAGMASIAMAIIAVGCFTVCAILIKKK